MESFPKRQQEAKNIVYVKGGVSEKLQKMQIIRADQLHTEKENNQENLRGQQEERGKQNIVNTGSQTKCPQCSRIDRVVWISTDRKTAGVQCFASRRLRNRPGSKFGSNQRS
jgi:hypothetical protein